MLCQVTCLALLAVAAAIPMQQNSASVGEWKVTGPAQPEDDITLSFAIKMEGEEALRAKFESVSDPKNADYGKYWTREELAAVVKPNPAALEVVTNYLAAETNGAVTVERGFVRTTLPATSVETLLNVNLFRFEHSERANTTIVRSLDQPQLPKAVAAAVDFVAGITSFPTVLKPVAELQLSAKVTPATLRKLYEVSDVASGKTTASQALAEFQGQKYSPGDLKDFLSKYKLPSQKMVNVSSGGSSMLGHTEANLDVQYILATGQGIPTDFYLESGMSFDLIGWITAVQKSLEGDVWSVSYGEDISQVTADYAQRLDKEFQAIATLGVTIVFASGDSGVYSRTGGYTRFHPSFPASLPTVTAVGSTSLNIDGTETKAAPFSGGGFCLSNYFTQPSYQSDAVKTFLSTSKTLPDSSLYDNKGRAFPDVSTLGVNFEVVVDRVTMPVGGTSASAPTFAGLLALLNDLRLQAGKPLIGFANPFLYQNAAAFNDIEDGCNNMGKKDSKGNPAGFCAIKGWDPVTGLGTPNYPKLKAAALA
eukprot:CAMPEP_0117026512 /NCGR_PEP_ID=MMETSP0472-20121206/19482_1 /TAXON_ID=693140 ORGANISM="Tiarina fusus, Strain LIS" /NCGR_SAMPLE_ID=MMETSP0472 /ASSEMBLY_ACC=CAM_ASM_000603 /LENGTH=535 /DNA_ID=CAMNT_0004733535 /DNA_START=6 /DNA_END=1613 /DNA_ORIENTATION=+